LVKETMADLVLQVAAPHMAGELVEEQAVQAVMQAVDTPYTQAVVQPVVQD
jgi:ABC-type dipeptide/oligopeptide/nickel transport system ATPase component